MFSNETLAWLSSGILAILWVSSYGYKYNVSLFNTHYINIWALLLWSANGYLFLRLCSLLSLWVAHFVLLLLAAWLLYFIWLLFFEYIGYYVLQIRERKGGKNDLVWGLVHGTPVLHLYYTLYPFIILAVYSSLEYFSGQMLKFAG